MMNFNYFFIMILDFYICRHGQTDKNVAGVWQGCATDVVLNATGYKQAKELAEKFRLNVIGLYCSPLVRAVQTANVIARNGVSLRDVVIMQDLRECNFGDAEGVSFEEIKRQYGEDFVNKILWPTAGTADLHFSNGESKKQVFERVYNCLKRIVCRHTFSYAPQTICVVCHAGVISALQFGLGLKDVSYEHCMPLHLQYDLVKHKFIQCFD